MEYNYLYEVWRPIKGYEGLYEVSNFGRVRSLDRFINGKNGYQHIVKGRILSQRKMKTGYITVHLSKYGIDERLTVHRLVATAFIPNPLNLPQVNHRDEDKTNNSVWNLEWCTSEYNSNYGTHKEKLRIASTGRKMPRYGVEKVVEKISKPVAAFNNNGEEVMRFKSAADANRINKDLNYVSISAACNGRLQTYRGFIWRFI